MLDMLALPTVGIMRVYEPFARFSILSFGQVYLSAGFLARLPIVALANTSCTTVCSLDACRVHFIFLALPA